MISRHDISRTEGAPRMEVDQHLSETVEVRKAHVDVDGASEHDPGTLGR